MRALDESNLGAPSELPGWSRLTIACHLRYGARALRWMTAEACAGRATAYYPEGRAAQREKTLLPGPEESRREVVEDLASASATLHQEWQALNDREWSTPVREPADNADLGTLQLSRLPLLRLTEVEVHGCDLAIGLSDWSVTFVDAALPTRVAWLNTRRSNHRSVDLGVTGTWRLVSNEGDVWRVSAHADGTVEAVEGDGPCEATIAASRRDLLATLLGRGTVDPVTYRGDVELAKAFGRAFPGP